MASLRIEETREIAAPAEAVWRHLIDPQRIVVCLPGASLDSVTDERNCAGRVTVKVGALSVSYRGTIEFTEIDHDSMRVRMLGKGREQGGAGSATMTMQSRVSETPAGAELVVDADVKLTGKIVRFGRGMIEAVAREIFTEFTARLEELLREVEDRAGEPEAGQEKDTTVGATDENAPLRLLPLIWRAVRSRIRRFFGRTGAAGR